MALVKRLVLALLVLVVTACGDGAVELTTQPPATSSGATNALLQTPNDLASVNCPLAGPPSGGSLIGLAATLDVFAASHGPQDPKHLADFGGTISGGPNAGVSVFTARCSPGGTIVSVDQTLSAAMTAKTVKAALKGYGILPADATLVSDTVPTPCEILIYHSAAIAAIADASDPAGTFLVELTPSNEAPGDLNKVDGLIYDLDTTGGC